MPRRLAVPPLSALLLAVLLAVLGGPRAGAGGTGEKAEPESAGAGPRGPLTVFLVLKPEESRNNLLVERFHLPSSLAALGWTEFRLEPSGNVELAAGGGYRLLSHQPVSEERLGELGVYGYALRVSWTEAGQAPRKTIALAFAYEEADSRGVILQPAQRALLEGIRRSGRQKGSARVLELTYQGGGRFRARVGLL
jgi:hypothetical protein